MPMNIYVYISEVFCMGLLPLACWDESSNPGGDMDVYFVGVVFFQLEVPATGRSLVQMSPSKWCV